MSHATRAKAASGLPIDASVAATVNRKTLPIAIDMQPDQSAPNVQAEFPSLLCNKKEKDAVRLIRRQDTDADGYTLVMTLKTLANARWPLGHLRPPNGV